MLAKRARFFVLGGALLGALFHESHHAHRPLSVEWLHAPRATLGDGMILV